MKRIDLSDLDLAGRAELSEAAEVRIELAARSAAKVLNAPGGVILVPTETVYGLLCNAADERAVARIYRLKARDGKKPLAWFVRDWRKLTEYGAILDDNARRLAGAHFPGPLTLVVPKTDGGTLGFRVPDHALVRRIMEKFDRPISSTSANLSGMPDALDLDGALAMLSGEVDLAVDGGAIAPGALASTVVKCENGKATVLRQGALSLPDGETAGK